MVHKTNETRREGKSISTLEIDMGEKDKEISMLKGMLRTKDMEIDRLRKLVDIDQMTGAGNRRMFDLMAKEIRDIGRRHMHDSKHTMMFSIVVVDLDNLKGVNDAGGHVAGDEIICKSAAVLQDAMREGDRVCRTGGDEFYIIIADSGRNAAEKAIGRAMKILESNGISASYGIASLEEFDINEENVIGKMVKSADERMYENKRAKR
ncbi:MAG: GGDEF domain-containing protein [Candidatus Marsarchaeota archaeon]|jgi:diguanylate cyclase (GGDEF)-like protein|nr:GGDEF domain-containing protein [Candidatus Marsarchaeota archaeon]